MPAVMFVAVLVAVFIAVFIAVAWMPAIMAGTTTLRMFAATVITAAVVALGECCAASQQSYGHDGRNNYFAFHLCSLYGENAPRIAYMCKHADTVFSLNRKKAVLCMHFW
jgi:hypothetical protein